MFNTILSWFGLGNRPGTGPSGVPKYTKKNVRPSNFYRRGGKYFSVHDDSLVEDLLLIAVLTEYYDEGDINDLGAYDVDAGFDPMSTNAEVETEVDLLDVDVDTIPVIESTPEPEPVVEKTSYSSGYSGGSDYSSSDSYDSGGSDD